MNMLRKELSLNKQKEGFVCQQMGWEGLLRFPSPSTPLVNTAVAVTS